MKQKRNSSAATLFWATLILLTILGFILTLLGVNPTTYPEEDSSYSTSVSHPSTDNVANSDQAVVEPETTLTPETTIIPETTIPSEPPSEPETLDPSESEAETEDTDEPDSDVIPDDVIKPTGTIYLTFDDGPSTKITSQILDILKENNIKATFFIVDYQVGSVREELVIRAFNEGHTIALHGTSHTYSKIYSSLEALIENFESLQEKVYNSTGYRSNIIRFPGGSSNTVSKYYCEGIMTDAVEYFSSTDFHYFDWNVDSQDAGGTTTADGVFENVTSAIKPGRNNIVLMHDTNSKTHTLEALQSIIDWAISEGYEFNAITEETPQITHRIAN